MPTFKRGDDFGNSLSGPIRTRRPFGLPSTAGRNATGVNRATAVAKQWEDYGAFSAIRTCPEFFDDFIYGTNAIGTDHPSPFTARLTGTPAGVAIPTGAGANGIVNAALAATNEQEFAGIDFANQTVIPQNKPFYYQVYANFPVLPTAVAAGQFAIVGLASAYNATIASMTRYAWFRLTASAALLIEAADGVTTTLATATGVTLVAGTNYLFTIVNKGSLGRHPGAVEFWIDDGIVGFLPFGGSLTTPYNDTTPLQPMIGVGKASGVGVPSIQVDYVRGFWDRF